MFEDSLLNHLAWRFRQPKEILATEALGFILAHSDACRTALGRVASDSGVPVANDLTYQTQALEAETGSPDAVGLLPTGEPQVILEGKFQAALTKHQPESYLRRLPKDAPGVLFFVVPAVTIPWRWQEIREKCADDIGTAAEHLVHDELRSIALRSGHQVGVVSWNFLLARLRAAADTASDQQAIVNLDQLKALCDSQDRQVFAPISPADLDMTVPQRIIDYYALIEEVVPRASRAGVVVTSGFNWYREGQTTRGHYVNIGRDRWEAALTLSPQLWRDHGYGPFWLCFTNNWTPGAVATHEKHARWPELRQYLAPLSTPTPTGGTKLRPILVEMGSGQPTVALRMPIGCDRPQVIDSIVEQLGEVNRLLGGLPVTPAGEG